MVSAVGMSRKTKSDCFSADRKWLDRVLPNLLAAVDFKWLMTGHGWWVDSARFHDDPSYAATLLGLAMASPSQALRDCAARLQAQMGAPASGLLVPAAHIE